MRALVCHTLSDDLGGVRVDDYPQPQPAKGEVLIRVAAAAANFPDLLMAQGKYQFKPPLPFVLGMEGAGVIVESNACATFKEGDQVVFGARYGAMAEYIAVPENLVFPRPASMDSDSASCYRVAYNTAYVGLCVRGCLRRGETLLIHGASGGIGMAAVDVGLQQGARVIATGSNPDKLKVIQARGAHHTIACPETVDFRQQVLDITEGAGADVVYDSLGGDWFDQSTCCIAWNGRLLVMGFASGRIPQIGANIPLIKGFSVIGVRAGEYGRRNPEAGAEHARTVNNWAEEGLIKPHICARLPLERAGECLDMLANRRVIGKVVINP